MALIMSYATAVLWFDDHYFPKQKFLEATGIMTTTSVVIGLLLAFRTNSAYERWWEGRKLWGQLVNDLRNLSAKAAVFVDLDDSQREKFNQLLIAFPAALKEHLRGQNVDLVSFGLRSAQPAEDHLPFHISRLIFETIDSWRKETKIDGFLLLALDVHARSLMDICGACERIKSSPIASSYKAIIWIWLFLYFAVVPWLLVPIFDLWALPLIVIGAYFIIALELLAEEVEEPFGTSANDLPLDSVCQNIAASIAQSLAKRTPSH